MAKHIWRATLAAVIAAAIVAGSRFGHRVSEVPKKATTNTPIATLAIDGDGGRFAKEYPEHNSGRGTAFFRSNGQAYVVVHGVANSNQVYARGKGVHPNYVVKILVAENYIEASEKLTFICCYPASKKSGQYMNVNYAFLGTKESIHYTGVTENTIRVYDQWNK